MKHFFYSRLSMGAIALVAMLVACSDDGSSDGVDNESISGVSQKGPFVSGSTVKIYELDGEKYAQTGKSFIGKITNDDGKFSVPHVTLAGRYALLEANGYYRDEVTGEKSEGTITLNALTDLGDRKNVNINLLTHLEYERALYLVGTGLSVKAAKKQAEAEVFNAFGIQGSFANSEDLDIFGKDDENAALLAFSVLMLSHLDDYGDKGGREARLTELLSNFAIDIEKDGTWDDEVIKAKIADWAQEEERWEELEYYENFHYLESIRSYIEEWDLGTVPDFEKYVRNFWYTNYGLGTCDKSREGEVMATKNEHSKTYGTQTRFICKGGAWVEASDIEKDSYKFAAGKDGEIKVGNVTKQNLKYDKKLMSWRYADELDTMLSQVCTQSIVGKRISGKGNNSYYCTVDGWVNLLGDWSWNVPKELRLNPEITYGVMTDSRDGKKYKTVKIGNMTWMAENLNYADSAATPSLKGRSWCYDDIEKNCDVGGRLYTWTAAVDSVKLYKDRSIECGAETFCTLPDTVHGICPPGWHLPSHDESYKLTEAVVGDDIYNCCLDEDGETEMSLSISKAFKSKGGWGENNGGTDIFGFSALPAGYKKRSYSSDWDNSSYFNSGIFAGFWIGGNVDKGKYMLLWMSFGERGEEFYETRYDIFATAAAFSVRCLKD